MRAVLRELQRDGAADAAATAGDQDGLALQMRLAVERWHRSSVAEHRSSDEHSSRSTDMPCRWTGATRPLS